MPDSLLLPADADAREAALDIDRSVIVQAPAGSGKTDLLTRRFLKLLAVVNEPEEILAITFTRAATAEMRARILSDLEAAAGRRPFTPDEPHRIALARAALAQSERRHWDLLNHPRRLAIETIDSLCLRIAHDRPLLAGLGGSLEPIEDAVPLHALAARRTLERLGSSAPELDAALGHLLDLRDNRLSDCEQLLVQMLATRDQWQQILPLSGAMTEDEWGQARSNLQAPFRREVTRALDQAHRLLTAEPALTAQLIGLAKYACSNGNQDITLLAELKSISSTMPIEHWHCICSLLLTDENQWRKSVDKRHGFPVGPPHPQGKQRKTAMLDLLSRFQQRPQLLPALSAIRNLPSERYSDEQWLTLRHILTVLRRAIAELKVVFAETNSVDFIEISAAALAVLDEVPDRLTGIGAATRHLLVDEFQDTSRRQHELVERLLSAWDPASDPGEHRTAFLVGDPMQSIYMFRQAEVELFTHVRDHGLGQDENCIHCDTVRLSVNFRSHSGLTAPLNSFFERIGAEPAPPGSAAVDFAPAISSASAPSGQSIHIHPQLIGSAAGRPAREECLQARRQEARDVLHVIERHLPRIEQARATGAEYRVAVLVRNRTHLHELVPLLRDRRIPFRAVEIDPLSARQELRDLLSLTRALLHPMDRVAWLSVLRAPWCGLALSDLHILTGSDHRAFRSVPIHELIDRHLHLLSPDGQKRLARTTQILRRALDLRWRQSESPSFASWIDRTWRTLGGPASIDAAAHENVQVFFSLLDSVAPDGLAPLTPAFEAALQRLYAQPDPSVSERCGLQLMTIHKAKGLGFDVVIVPGLDRGSSKDDPPLLCSLERRNPFGPGQDEFLVAPIGAKGDDSSPLYQWVRKQRSLRFDEERKRLFYVACTRARQELHLLGTATVSSSGLTPGSKNSLLATAWPALHAEFEALQQAPAPSSGRILAFPEPAVLEEIAAVAESASTPPTFPRRLPLGFEPVPAAENVTVTGVDLIGQPDPREFRRPEGSRLARLIGSAVHALLQRFGAELASLPAAGLRAHAAALLRASALTGEALASATETVTNLLLACAADPVCRWILAPHPEAQSEAAWSGYISGSSLRTLRADRVFRAGAAPLAEGSDCLWVVDYKTGSAPSGDRSAFLAAERALYAPQLLAYARVLRALHGAATPIRLGLYYPAIAAFDSWDPGLD